MFFSHHNYVYPAGNYELKKCVAENVAILALYLKKYMHSSSNDHINPLWGHQPSSHPAYRSAKGIHCYKPGEKGDFYCGP